MQEQDHNRADESPNGELDALIAQSLAIPSDTERVERLEAFWHVEIERRRRTLWMRRATLVAAAASLLFVLIGSCVFSSRSDDEPVHLAQEEDPKPLPPEEVSPRPATDAPPPSEPRESRSAGRAPTEYERFMFLAQTQARAAAPKLTLEELVPKAIEQVAARPQGNVPAIVQQLTRGQRNFDRREWEDVLLAALADLPIDSPDNYKAAICRLLASYGSERSVPMLLEVAKSRSETDDALAAIEAIVGVDRWTEVARQASDGPTRQAIASRLVLANSEQALLAYLAMVGDPLLRDDALTAAMDVPQLPVEQLVAQLDQNRCEMTEALIARIEERPSRSKEAWFALFSCRCDAADNFLSQASQSPRLLGQLNNARLQWLREVQ